MQADQLTAPKCAREPDQQERFITETRQIVEKRLNHLTQKWREDGRFAIGRDPFSSPDAAHGTWRACLW